MVKSDYYLMIDADFRISASMNAKLSSFHMANETCLVIPCFNIESRSFDSFNGSMDELQVLVRNGQADSPDEFAGHHPTLYDIFMMTKAASYSVNYETLWEPYYVISRSAPLYDERFVDQGGDKQSHCFLLNALKYKFVVLTECFLYQKKEIRPWLKKAKENQFSLLSHFYAEMDEKYGLLARIGTARWTEIYLQKRLVSPFDII